LQDFLYVCKIIIDDETKIRDNTGVRKALCRPEGRAEGLFVFSGKYRIGGVFRCPKS
jgi:hypothetical protein